MQHSRKTRFAETVVQVYIKEMQSAVIRCLRCIY